MKPLLLLALFACNCTAACVWLRDTSSNAGLAWCVNGSTKEEGFFRYKFDEDISDLTPVQLHKKINRQYAKQALRGQSPTREPVLLSSKTDLDNQNWTMSTPSFFGNMLDGGLTAVSDASDRLSNTIADQIEKVMGWSDDNLPYAECKVMEDRECVHRIEHNLFQMSQEQITASNMECHSVCNDLGRHCISKHKFYPKKTVMHRRCCSCLRGHEHSIDEEEPRIDWKVVE